jgi:hypothetical protein
MQKLLSLILGVAVTINLSAPQQASAQLWNVGSIAQQKTLKASVHLDHKLSRVNGHEGALTVEVHGGVKPIHYQWSNGSTLNYINGLGAGRYTVMVTDATGLRVTTAAEIDGFDCEAASCEFRTQTQGGWGAGPNGNNSGVYLHANFTAAFPSGLVVGCDYTLTLTSAQAVTDFLPSTSTADTMAVDRTDPAGGYNNVLAGQVVALALNLGFDSYDANFGTSTASLGSLVIASGDFAGLTVQQLFDEANAFLGGCASAYTASQLNAAVTAVNENFDNGTQNNGYVLCPEASTLDVTVSATGETCAGLCNGTVEAMVTGGATPYSYLWSGGETSSSLSGLCAANYSVTVTDELGCEVSGNADVDPSQNTLRASTTKTDITCNGDGDGSISITIDEGAGPFSYTWNPAISNSESANYLGAGIYQIHIEDGNGCATDVQEEIEEPETLLAAGSKVDATCANADGSASVLASGGTEPYGYVWSPNGETTADIYNLSAGSYSVVVTDANGCTADAGVNIQGSSVQLQTSEEDASCPGMADGSATVFPSGGAEPYTYLWSPAGGTDATATGLAAGLYTVTVTDDNGCIAITNVEVGNINAICNTRFASANNPVQNLSVYPSIVSDEVKIVSTENETLNATITITSLEGKVAYNNVISLKSHAETAVNTSDFAPGIYSMNIQTESQNQVFRIVKK